MSQEPERRLARNEALFRETNEAIERGQWPGDPAKRVRFRCECSLIECDRPVELTIGQYEQVRRFSRHFVLVPGHELPEIERVVDRGAEYVVVEKQETAGATASANDPRQE